VTAATPVTVTKPPPPPSPQPAKSKDPAKTAQSKPAEPKKQEPPPSLSTTSNKSDPQPAPGIAKPPSPPKNQQPKTRPIEPPKNKTNVETQKEEEPKTYWEKHPSYFSDHGLPIEKIDAPDYRVHFYNWLQKYATFHRLVTSLKFNYVHEKKRFTLSYKPSNYVEHSSLSIIEPQMPLIKGIGFTPQLAYALGFDDKWIHSEQMAEHPVDLQAGFHHLYVYAHDLTENIVVGDKMASLLRIVTVTGQQDDVVEVNYDNPIMSRVVPNEINQIEIEIRRDDGRLVPFEWGTVIITLVFKKAVYL
jgi:hypothetical protein